MSYPAGNINWLWKWKGFYPPLLTYTNKFKIDFSKFQQCFDTFYGIAEFDYWISNELEKLSKDDKVELVNLLKKYNKEKRNYQKM